MSRWIWIAVFFAASSSVAGDAIRIENQEFGFSFVLPDNFVEGERPKHPRQLYDFKRSSGNMVTITIVGMGQTMLARGTIPPPVRTDADVKVVTGRWDNRDIDVIEMLVKREPDNIFELIALVPLEKEAIGVQVVGREHSKSDVQSVLTEFLNNLAGKSAPKAFAENLGKALQQMPKRETPFEEGQKFGRAIGQLLVPILVLILVCYLVMRSLKSKKDVKP